MNAINIKPTSIVADVQIMPVNLIDTRIKAFARVALENGQVLKRLRVVHVGNDVSVIFPSKSTSQSDFGDVAFCSKHKPLLGEIETKVVEAYRVKIGGDS
ncbi:MAG: septation protein SpoVG family protein [Deltaproteobacteria bacterium]|nr:septation protein SpoVG family protein [Deltaproteobacteria bacterium]